MIQPANSTLALIGLGNMGMPMLQHLTQAGYTVQCFARKPDVKVAAVQLGATVCNSPAQAAQGAQLVITNVTSTADVEQVLLGEQGAIHGLQAGAICMDHSTIGAQATQTMAQQLATFGVTLLDAPVSGGVAGAIAGTLSIMVGGDETAFAAVQTVLACYGKTIVHVGASGSGQVVKACNQMVQVVNIQGIAEAMLFAQTHGVDTAKVLSCLSAGMAGSKMLDLMGDKMSRGDFAAGIQARLHYKDFGLVADMAKQAGLNLPAVKATQAQLNSLMDLGMGYDDTSSLLRVLHSQSQVNR